MKRNTDKSDILELEMEIVTLPEPGHEYEYECGDGVLIEEVVDWNEHEEEFICEVNEPEALPQQECEEPHREEDEFQYDEVHQNDQEDNDNDAEREAEYEEYKEQRQSDLSKETTSNMLANKKRKPEHDQSSVRFRKRKRPLGYRYQLFDKLAATIVDYNVDSEPIVQFSATTRRERETLPVECGLCYAITTKAQALPHRQTHLQPNTQRFQCNYCEKMHEKYEKLAGHVRRHMSIQPYVCDICTQYFCTKSAWYLHVRRRHQRFPCLLCAEMFNNHEALCIHVRNVHKNQQQQLERHREKMHAKGLLQ